MLEITYETITENRRQEIILNYHLSELDRLKKQTQSYNSIIENNLNRVCAIQTRPDAQAGKMDTSISQLAAAFEESVDHRDSLWKFVDYHRTEIERIGVRSLEIRKAAGENSPASVVGSIGYNAREWEALFGIGKAVRRVVTP